MLTMRETEHQVALIPHFSGGLPRIIPAVFMTSMNQGGNYVEIELCD